MNEKYIKAAEDLRKELHNIPEESMREVKTKALLMDFIKQNTCLSVTDCGSYFYASYIYSVFALLIFINYQHILFSL